MDQQPTDPKNIEALQRQIAELQAELRAVQELKATDPDAQHDREAFDQRASSPEGDDAGVSIETQGGAAVQGSVKVGGHFIGRDFIQIVKASSSRTCAKCWRN